ncbi:hypothetical protein Tco_0465533 [Tanacetum coccineum]
MKIAQFPIVKRMSILWRKEFTGTLQETREEDCKTTTKPPKNTDQRAFIGGVWGDNGEDEVEKTKDEACLVAQRAPVMTYA